MTKTIKLIFGVVIFSFFAAGAVYAFKTFYWGGGTIHQEITASALIPLGVSEKSFKIIDEGNTWQDNPAPTLEEPRGKLFVPSRHFDDNDIKNSFKFVDDRYEYIKKRAVTAYKDEKAYKDVLDAFGELLHTMQDFYAHTNYIELYLKKRRIEPNAVPLVDKGNLPAGLRSGYFYYGTPVSNEVVSSRDESCNMIMQDYPGIPPFLRGEELEKRCNGFAGYINYAIDPPISVLHLDINKDDAKTRAGSTVVPGIGKNIYQYAYNLAVRQTERQWKYLEELIRKTYPQDANKIIQALKTGIISAEGPVCEGIEKPQAELSGLKQKASDMGTNLKILEDSHSKAAKTEVDLLNIIQKLEDLEPRTASLRDYCLKGIQSGWDVQQFKSSLDDTGSRVVELRKNAEVSSVMACELANKARQATDPTKRSNLRYNCGQFAKQARLKAQEARELVEKAKSSLQQIGHFELNQEADELRSSFDTISSRLNDQRIASGDLASLQFNAGLNYSSIDALNQEAQMVYTVISDLIKPCPKDASIQHILNETDKLCNSISEVHKQSKVHFDELEATVKRHPIQLSRAEDIADNISKNMTGCGNITTAASGLKELQAVLSTCEVFEGAALKFATDAERCAASLVEIPHIPEETRPPAIAPSPTEAKPGDWTLKEVKLHKTHYDLYNQETYRSTSDLQQNSASLTTNSWAEGDTYSSVLSFSWVTPPSVLKPGQTFQLTFQGNASGSPQEKCAYGWITYCWVGFDVKIDGKKPAENCRDINVGMTSTKEWFPTKTETATFTVLTNATELAIYVSRGEARAGFVYERKGN